MKSLLLAMTCLGACPFPAAAQTAAGYMEVSTEVVATCLFSTYGIAFGARTTGGQQAAQCTGAIGVLNLSLGNGQHFSGGSRRISDGVNYIDYALSLEGAALPDLTEADGVPIFVSNATGAGERRIHGRILSGQGEKPSGLYTDSVVATLTW